MKALFLTALLLPLGFSAPSFAKGEYSIKLSYDASSKDLSIDYEKDTSSICSLSAGNLIVSDETPSLSGSLDVGLISFEVYKPQGAICLTALGKSRGSLLVPGFSGKAHSLIIDGESYGFIILDEGEAKLVEELPNQGPQQAAKEYSIEFDYDPSTKNLVVSYLANDLKPSICQYEAKNLLVSTSGTPTLANPVKIGLISFDTDKAADGICLAEFGYSGGNISIDSWNGIPSLLLIDGVAYGYVSLDESGQAVELLPELHSGR